MSIEADIRANLIAITDEYARATRMPQRTVSRRLYGNANFLADFKAGRCSVSLAKLDELMNKLRESWPPNATWPAVQTVFMLQKPTNHTGG